MTPHRAQRTGGERDGDWLTNMDWIPRLQPSRARARCPTERKGNVWLLQYQLNNLWAGRRWCWLRTLRRTWTLRRSARAPLALGVFSAFECGWARMGTGGIALRVFCYGWEERRAEMWSMVWLGELRSVPRGFVLRIHDSRLHDDTERWP